MQALAHSCMGGKHKKSQHCRPYRSGSGFSFIRTGRLTLSHPRSRGVDAVADQGLGHVRVHRRRLAWQHERWHLAAPARKSAVLGRLREHKVTQALLMHTQNPKTAIRLPEVAQALLKQTLNPKTAIRLPEVSLTVTCRLLGSDLWTM